MTTTQFYREPMSVEDASFEIEKGSGKKYDPKLVEAFKKALPVMIKVREAYSDKLGDMINLDFSPKIPGQAGGKAGRAGACGEARRRSARRCPAGEAEAQRGGSGEGRGREEESSSVERQRRADKA
jgi:hypothetical protein